jgi:hypothetical protein
MKKIVFFILILIAFNSCERDDICIDEITPRLVIRFYDVDDEASTKAVTDIEVKIDGKDDEDGYTDGGETIRTSTDSIAIPLRVDQQLTKYYLTINHSDENAKNTDTLTVNYITESVFVGRSCGHKSIFNNSQYGFDGESPSENNWIKRIEVVTTTINNEEQAHIKIFH